MEIPTALRAHLETPAVAQYWHMHQRRFAYALRLIERFASPGASILDIGASPLTLMIQEALPQARLHTLGWLDPNFGNAARHYAVDLRECDLARNVPEHDLTIFCEVLEHLETPADIMFAALRRWTKPGGVILAQTPNAASLPKRLRLLIGDNPYPMLRAPNREFSHHLREYTAAELRLLGEAAGLEVIRVDCENYFNHGGPRGEFWTKWGRYGPAAWRDGITACFRRPAESRTGGAG